MDDDSDEETPVSIQKGTKLNGRDKTARSSAPEERNASHNGTVLGNGFEGGGFLPNDFEGGGGFLPSTTPATEAIVVTETVSTEFEKKSSSKDSICLVWSNNQVGRK